MRKERRAVQLQQERGFCNSKTEDPERADAAPSAGAGHPIIPPLAKQARVQGQVVLQAVIGKDGKVESLVRLPCAMTIQSPSPGTRFRRGCSGTLNH